MKYYLAPMEGITGYIFRNSYRQVYPGTADRFFSPFIGSAKLKGRVLRDVLPENNKGICLIPQILCNRADLFLEIAEQLEAFGYDTVNLNLGCPSGTVVAKGKGAGFLAFPDQLDRFLEAVFQKCPLRISIKTRIGVEQEDEWPALLQVFQQYPLEELIVHPRTRANFYQGQPRMGAWEKACRAYRQSGTTLCYNGNIFTEAAYDRLIRQYPETGAVMLGRGILQDPGLLLRLRQADAAGQTAGIRPETVQTGTRPETVQEERDRLREFLEILCEGYQKEMSGERDVLFKLKELWSYLGEGLQLSGQEKKKIRKVQTLSEYKCLISGILTEKS